MRRVSKIGVVLAVAMLVAGLAAPASAKKGGHPGAPSGTGLEVTVEPRGNMMWANSVGDQILFDITVTNSSGVDLTGVTVKFMNNAKDVLGFWSVSSPDPEPSDPEPPFLSNDSWSETYTYTVGESDVSGPVNEQNPVTVGTVTATAGTDETVKDSDDAVMTAYPVEPCAEPNAEGFIFGTDEDYSVCSFTPTALPAYWTLTTELPNKPRGKSGNPGVTVRDGVPGNWCDYDLLGPLQSGEPYLDKDVWKVDSSIYLPGDGTCLHGGGRDTIPVRNTDTFYLATWAGNVVTATPCTIGEDGTVTCP